MKSIKDIIEEGNTQRRKEDNVEELINKEGFHYAYGGRSSTIYYVDAGQLCELYCESGGGDTLSINFEDLSDWILPVQRKMTGSEKKLIKHRLKLWLDKEKIKTDIDS